MKHVVVIGSGASGVHFAQTLLEKNYRVTLLDVGHPRPPAVHPQKSLNQLKASLEDSHRWFLGGDYQAVIYPDNKGEYYGFPPAKDYVFDDAGVTSHQADGFEPLFSYAGGGLAESWTAGVYPFNDQELEDFPFGYDDIAPYYEKIAARIGICGSQDDLERYSPVHGHISPPLEPDAHTALLMDSYNKRRAGLQQKQSFYLGRSRIAVLSADHDDRKACDYLGRCLWGCPNGALYTPSLTLAMLRRHENFTYMPGIFVHHLIIGRERQVTGVAYDEMSSGIRRELPATHVALAAGALSSSHIYLNTVREHSGERVRLGGLMDNRQVLMPFFNWRMIGVPFKAESYQYHQLAFGFDNEPFKRMIHGQITTLKTALIHPIVQNLPVDLKSGLSMFRNIHTSLGVVNLMHSDTARDNNYVTLNEAGDGEKPGLKIVYSPPAEESAQLKESIANMRRVLRKLGCFAPGSMIHIRPMGASVHYAGTLPMAAAPREHGATPLGESSAFGNLFLIDGVTFPFLPAKQYTFTLMANAMRIADQAF